MVICGSIDGSPHWFSNKQPHCFDVVLWNNRTSTNAAQVGVVITYLWVQRKPVIHPGRQNDEVTFDDFNAYPPVLMVPHVKVATPLLDQPDLFVCVQVFLKESLYLGGGMGKGPMTYARSSYMGRLPGDLVFLITGNWSLNHKWPIPALSFLKLFDHKISQLRWVPPTPKQKVARKSLHDIIYDVMIVGLIGGYCTGGVCVSRCGFVSHQHRCDRDRGWGPQHNHLSTNQCCNYFWCVLWSEYNYWCLEMKRELCYDINVT